MIGFQTMNINKKLVIYIILGFILLTNCANPQSPLNLNPLFLVIANQTSPKTTLSCPLVPRREEFADTVTQAVSSSDTFGNPSMSVDGVCGGGENSGSLDVFSLSQTGSGSSLVLSWGAKTIANQTGIDFMVFENPWRIGSDSTSIFMEAIIVEVSQDNVSYCGFNPNYTQGNLYSRNPTHWQNFAGKTPVLYNDATNRLDSESLFNPSLAGGDGFDLDNLSDSNYFNIGCTTNLRDTIKTNGFKYIRLTSASARTNSNTGNPYPFDSAASNGPDIDGVAARYRN